VPGGAGNTAGVQAGDILISVAGIDVSSNSFGEIFRQRFSSEQAGASYDLMVVRNGVPITLSAELEFAELTSSQIEEDLRAGEKAHRILEGLLTGSTGR
jgi:S1-C subfamily serine protease